MAGLPVLCLPHAGAGATVYRGWRPDDALGIEIVPLQLAGREERFGEPPAAGLAETLADLVDQVRRLQLAEPCAVFGHSFGAVLAFELARLLPAAGVPVQRLVASGSAHPGQLLGRHSAGLPDAEFVARVEELAGYTHPALLDPDMRELVLPVLRSDVEQHEGYRPAAEQPIATGISVFRGSADHLVSTADCAGWADWTEADLRLRTFPGGHMYLAEHPEAVWLALAEECAGAVAATGGRLP